MIALALGALLAAAEDAPVVERSIESMSLLELKAEYARLETTRPGLGLPITLVCVGAGSIAYGAFFFLSLSSTPGGSGAFGYLFGALLVGGAAMLIPGVWIWWNRKQERAESGERMDAINERIEELDRGPVRQQPLDLPPAATFQL